MARHLATRPALIYSNTITNGREAEMLARMGSPVLTHVRELEGVIEHVGRANLEAVVRTTRAFIACSTAAKANLVERHGIDPDRVRVVHNFIPVEPGADDPNRRLRARRRVLAELGLPIDALLVGACGAPNWHKGPDLFIRLVHAIRQRRADLPVHGVWVGGEQPGGESLESLREAARAQGIGDRVHFVGARPDVLDCFRAIDVFALVSREEAFGLVCLEAGSVGTPTVCFAGAGGASEFVEDDCGVVVPYLDVDGMAEATMGLFASEALLRACGARAAEKARARHDVSVGAPRIAAIIDEFLDRRPIRHSG